MKVEINSQKINPFGGINFVIEEIRRLEIQNMMDNFLGMRGKGSKYSFSDIITNIWYILFCGGDCAEDINTHLRQHLENIPGLKLPSADTLLLGQRELSEERVFTVSEAGNIHEVVINEDMNKLALKMQKKLGLLKKGEKYILDFDHQFLPCEKFDATRGYKQEDGYFPGVCIIKGMPVYIENRSGHTHVKYLQEETLERAFSLLKEEDITIDRCRMDCGSYAQKIINVVEVNSKNFYIRAQKCERMEILIHQIVDWQKVKINEKSYEVASIEYFPFGQKNKGYRLVIMREPNKTGQMDLFTKDAMIYRSILTNDWKRKEKKIIEFYNARGASEKVFDMMNNDFGWNKLPFSFMEENTVYLIITGMCRSFFKYLIEKYANKFSFLENNFRLKKFIFRFIMVGSKWIKRSRQNILKLYTNKPYQLALGQD